MKTLTSTGMELWVIISKESEEPTSQSKDGQRLMMYKMLHGSLMLHLIQSPTFIPNNYDGVLVLAPANQEKTKLTLQETEHRNGYALDNIFQLISLLIFEKGENAYEVVALVPVELGDEGT